MGWYLVKGILLIFPFFIAMGIVGYLLAYLLFYVFLKANPEEWEISERLNNFLKISIWICFIVGGFFFILIGMFYATYTLSLTSHINKWLAIFIVSIYLLLISTYSFREASSLNSKNNLFIDFDFFHDNKKKFSNYRQIVTQNVLHGMLLLFPSYIFFLLLNSFADTFSFGLNSYLIELIK